MRAITIQQPWCWAVIHGGKNVENRTRLGTWKPAEGARIAIHAGLRWSDRGERSPLIGDAFTRASGLERRGFGVRGAIIGTVDVTEVHRADNDCDPDICEPWGEIAYRQHDGPVRRDIVHLILENPRPVEPIDCRGALGLWRLPDHVARELQAVQR